MCGFRDKKWNRATVVAPAHTFNAIFGANASINAGFMQNEGYGSA
jgi:hypothetical protein